MTTKNVYLTDFLTEREIKRCGVLCRKVEPSKRNAAIIEQVIAPNLERINRALGQDNDPKFLAYAVEHTMLVRPPNRGRNTPKGFGRADRKL
jgi:hypothetical protein